MARHVSATQGPLQVLRCIRMRWGGRLEPPLEKLSLLSRWQQLSSSVLGEEIHLGDFLFIEFVGVTLVNKILQASGAQFYHTWSVQCIACSPPQVGGMGFFLNTENMLKTNTDLQHP